MISLKTMLEDALHCTSTVDSMNNFGFCAWSKLYVKHMVINALGHHVGALQWSHQLWGLLHFSAVAYNTTLGLQLAMSFSGC